MSAAIAQSSLGGASGASSSAATSASSHADNTAPTLTPTSAPTGAKELQAPDISSPHQLIDWVDTVMSQLESRFDDMNAQVTARMNEMSSRIDALETSIQDLIHGTLAPVSSNASDTP
ncbi:uncharacterized protein UMAG_11671 [Mycosarcoma maydis]|uniref:Heat shock factor-binding protein 1 n=1 Tax=Mycosarcoma maydis TaxID=5270 RepID=A0A0D1CAE4_MYCMD|nr:uncharacterized protein UMAG_11671 [Ustilago maydis 521]KIS70317.1 hypothetical protein UMAG_11671 [Ustilago maydis 521]|eukprot:XP_011388067.1 hypothetical protein UMAG_11671 [Ustilago maydis 521]